MPYMRIVHLVGSGCVMSLTTAKYSLSLQQHTSLSISFSETQRRFVTERRCRRNMDLPARQTSMPWPRCPCRKSLPKLPVVFVMRCYARCLMLTAAAAAAVTMQVAMISLIMMITVIVIVKMVSDNTVMEIKIVVKMCRHLNVMPHRTFCAALQNIHHPER